MTSTRDLDVANVLKNAIEEAKLPLKELNDDIHSHPELNYQEHYAHDAIVATLQKLGFTAKPHAYDVPTSFEAEFGSGGRLVVFNAEYDALPEIGHACGHNLIATSSFAGFLATAAALKSTGKPGRVRLLGTPAEEGGCGKGMLIGKDAYQEVDACVMAHPAPLGAGYAVEKFNGNVYVPHVATLSFTISFKGKTTHAAASPWEGVNALDAIVLGYNAVSMLRQQILPTSRIHGVITDGGLRQNIIPDHSQVKYCVRATSVSTALELRDRVIECFRAGSVATGCEIQIEGNAIYADLKPNKIMCQTFSDAMEALDMPMYFNTAEEYTAGGTDQGNVGYVVPIIHPIYGIEAQEGQFNHTTGFTEAAGKESAFERTLKIGQGLAQTAWTVLSNDEVAAAVKEEFESGVAARRGKGITAEEELAMLTVFDKSAFSQDRSKVATCSCGHN